MAENFTNIAGGPFQPYIAKQIEVRKNYIKGSHSNRTNEHLLYSNNRNAWIRLTSGTNLTSEHPIAKKYNMSGDELAKKHILQGGSVELKDGNIVNRGGIGEGKQYGYLPSKPLGFKPLPGITSIDISSAGKLGTLQYSTIRFVCYDIEQLEIYEALFLKLGFSMILEWGHTYYLDNDTGTLSKPSPLSLFNYSTKEDLMKAIQNNRVSHSGNYDAMFGTVSNFGWEFQKDGSYLCEIKLVGAGDILESLKLNQSVGKNTQFLSTSQFDEIEAEIAGLDEEDIKNLPSSVGDRDLSLFNRAIFDLRQVILYNSTKENNSGVSSTGILSSTYRGVLNNIFSKCPYDFIQFDGSGNILGDTIAKRGNHYSILNGLEKEENIPILKPSLFNGFSVNYNINDNSVGSDVDEAQEQVYITLGNLLAIMTATGMIYDSSTNGKGKPYIYTDFNDSLNYCYTYKGQLSIDPQICMIPRNQSNTEDLFGIGIVEDKLFNSINGVSVEESIESKTGLLKNSYLNTQDSLVRAKLMYILVNVNHITDILRELRNNNEKGVANYSDFLNKLLSDISKSCGGFHEFRLLVDDTSKSLRIIDDNKLSSYEEFDNVEKYTEIPIFGNESIVYDYSFKSRIGKEMASMITIAAQAQPATLGDDSFAISNLSKGLEDRYMKYKFTSEVKSEEEQSGLNEESLKTFQTHIKNIYEGDGSNFIINTELIEPSYNIYRELMANYRIEKEPNNKGTTLIPLDFNITLDGLSGIIPNSAFCIPTNLLPTSYKTKDGKSKIAFILHHITQNFDNNKWTTKLTGQTLNIRFDRDDIKEQPDNSYKGIIFPDSPLSGTPNIFLSDTCTRRASSFFAAPITNVPIGYLKSAAREAGLTSPQAIASLIAIAAGETGLNPRSEGHVYRSEASLRKAFSGLSRNQINRALKKGISKKDFFNIVYGEYDPSRVGNRNVSDGGKYYGRGYIQLTGYGNYKRYAKLSGIDILSNPELVNHPIYGAKISAVYFKDRVQVDQFSNNYFQVALRRVGYNVGDSYQKKTEYYNCYKNKV